MKLIGEVRIFVNENLVIKDRNVIRDPLKAYFRDVMDAPGDKALDNLFSADGEVLGGTEDGKDGILIRVGTSEFTMITTTLTADNTFGKKWRGEYTNTSGGTQSISGFVIGHNFNSTGSPFFGTRYATYDPTAFDAQDQDSVIIEWEIFLS